LGPYRVKWLDNETILILGPASSGSSPPHIIIYNLNSDSVNIQPLCNSQWKGFAYIKNGLASYQLTGTVKNTEGAGLIRTVRAIHRDTGNEMGSTVSAIDGTFTMKVYTADPLIVMSVGENTERIEIFDAVVADPWV
jgi:hypothetical protein